MGSLGSCLLRYAEVAGERSRKPARPAIVSVEAFTAVQLEQRNDARGGSRLVVAVSTPDLHQAGSRAVARSVSERWSGGHAPGTRSTADAMRGPRRRARLRRPCPDLLREACQRQIPTSTSTAIFGSSALERGRARPRFFADKSSAASGDTHRRRQKNPRHRRRCPISGLNRRSRHREGPGLECVRGRTRTLTTRLELDPERSAEPPSR